MSDTQSRITEYTEQYMEKVFYFCLRKCGDPYDAEDLTQDISLAVLTELGRGVEPRSFPAWVWQIARNRYARFAERKHRRGEWEVDTPLEDCEASDGSSIEEEYLRQEALSLLRRELAFISSDYRDILVAYYIDDRSVRDIAASLSLPEGTVKARLFRARTILKEGMNMAREFGKRSYKPENILFKMSGIVGRNGEPLSQTNDLLSKNILLSSYERPQTAEEIAVETGVALPYVQERLNALVGGTLMRRIGEHRYAPAFYIVSKDIQERILAVIQERKAALTDVIIRMIDHKRAFHEANGSAWQEGYQAEEDTRWARLMLAVDDLTDAVNTTDMYLPEPDMSAAESDFSDHFTSRPNGGKWELLGEEAHELPNDPPFVGMHGCMSANEADYDLPDYPCFWQYKFEYRDIAAATPLHLSLAEGKVLREIARGHGDSVDADIRRALLRYGYVTERDGVLTPTFLVCDHSKSKPLTAEQEAVIDALRERAKAIIAELRLIIAEMIINDAPAHLRDLPRAINYAISVSSYNLRGVVLEAALEKGYLTYECRENEARERMLGAYLEL